MPWVRCWKSIHRTVAVRAKSLQTTLNCSFGDIFTPDRKHFFKRTNGRNGLVLSLIPQQEISYAHIEVFGVGPAAASAYSQCWGGPNATDPAFRACSINSDIFEQLIAGLTRVVCLDNMPIKGLN